MAGPLVRSAILLGVTAHIRAHGRQAAGIARRTGIPPAALRDPDLLVRAGDVMEFFELAARTCRNRNWALEFSAQARLASIIGPLWILLRNARSVRQMCEDLVSNFDLYTTAAVMHFEPSRDGGVLSWSAAAGQAGSEVQMAEFALAVFLREIRGRAPPQWEPLAVTFRHAAPANLRLHRQVFGRELRFNCERNAIHLDRATLERPLRPSAPHARGLIRSVLRAGEPVADHDVRPRVEGIVRALLPVAPCALRDVARAMGLSARTLQEHLQRAGTTFRSVKDAVRADLALKYLHHSSMSAAQIADTLGYTDVTSLSRSFRRWHADTLRGTRSRRRATPRQLSTS